MKSFFILFSVIALAICFIIDPTPTVAEDTTDKTVDRYLHDTLLDNDKNKNDRNKIQGAEHFCPKCDSHSLTFERLNTLEGKHIQIVSCKTCGFEWREAWTLPNWFWLKSLPYLPHNHWTAQKWNEKQ
jgi:Zn ribbon nucleic-acid-binding protein